MRSSSPMKAPPEPADPTSQAIEAERLRNLDWANLIRSAGSVAWLVLNLILAFAAGEPLSRAMLPVQAAFALLATGWWLAARRSPRVRRASWLCGIFVDIPFVAGLTWFLVEHAPTREHEVLLVAGGNSVLLLMVGAHLLLIRRAGVIAAAALAAALDL